MSQVSAPTFSAAPASTPTESTSAPASLDAATPTEASTGLPDGYRLEVEQTGERSGIIRLTDPNIRLEYPTTDNSAVDGMPLNYEWDIVLGDSWYLTTNWSGGIGNEPIITLQNMSNDLYNIVDNEYNRVAQVNPLTDGNTLVYQFDIPEGYDFSWAEIRTYEVTIVNAAENVEIYATIDASNAVTIAYDDT
jgi:hypothetical protein